MCIINYVCEFPFIILAADVRGLEFKWLRVITPAPEVPCSKSPFPNIPCIKTKKQKKQKKLDANYRSQDYSIILLGYSASNRLFSYLFKSILANEHMRSSQ